MTVGAKNLVGFCSGAVIVMCLHTLRERSSAGPPQRTVRLLAADSLTADAGDDATLLSAVRAQASEVRSLISRTEQMERTLSDILEDSKGGGSSSESSTSTSSARAGRTCPAGCTRHGNCDELSGQCACPPTYTGAACDVPTMPACSTRGRHGRRRGRRRGGVDVGGTGGGGDGTEEEDESFVNLSGIASENFWWMMRDVKPKPSEDPRRASPPFRWVGLVTCECVRQSLAFLSLASSAEPAPWPRYIGHTELSMVRAACVDEPEYVTVGSLWDAGPNRRSGAASIGGASSVDDGAIGRALRWSYVPLVAWLKPFPAHSPMLLPLGLVTEALYTQPKDPHLMFLQHTALLLDSREAAAAASPSPARPLAEMLPMLGEVWPSPRRLCNAECHGAGWCGIWRGVWGRTRRRCHCLSNWLADSRSVEMARQRKGAQWKGPERARGHTSGPATCAPVPRAWQPGMEVARYARSPDQMESLDAAHNQMGPDRWRVAQPTIPRAKACPNECLGRGTCSYGFCHCQSGYWGLDCGFSSARVAALSAAGESAVRPRIFVYEVPASIRRSCAPWTLPEDLGDRLLLSEHLEPDPMRADLYWVYGCPNGDTILPVLRWIKRAHPFWNASVREWRARHVIAVGHEEGWAEVWNLLGRWLGPNFDHSNVHRGWDDLHPASPTRQLASVQLHGSSDYTANGRPRRRGVSAHAACRVCFQPGKDVMIPGFPGIMDYPDDMGRPALYKIRQKGGRVSQCQRLAEQRPYEDDGIALAPRTRSPQLFMAGALQTKTHGPGLYEPSRLVPYSCWKNRSKENDFQIVQTESVTVSVSPWEIEHAVDPWPLTRQASLCAVPEGKIGSYGHRSTNSLMLGCVPLLTKELYCCSWPLMIHDCLPHQVRATAHQGALLVWDLP